MKNTLAIVCAVLLASTSLSGCASVMPLNGSLYTAVQGPLSMGNGTNSSKTGEATATSILGVATGDASIATAMKNGGITRVHHVDTRVKNVLGIYAEFTTIVYGD